MSSFRGRLGFLKRINWFYFYLVCYATFQTQAVLRLIPWVDSHDPILFQEVYVARFNLAPEVIFAVSSVILFAFLILICNRKGISRSILGIASFFGSLAFAIMPLNGPGPLYSWVLTYAIVAAIFVFAAGEDRFARSLEKLPLDVLQLEYDEHKTMIGPIIQGATILLATGGLTFLLSSTFQNPFFASQLTRAAWNSATFIMLFTIGWGIYGVLILRYFLTMIDLKRRIFRLKGIRY